ncbi:ankyrin-3-like [Microplitis mediator]|uniref:ankyrin-3-like n=1 Tax=Microplitis mediator TaxID=375433 RepID=UPI002557B2B5|nr:ankyrin-3-like [Microplitis mediator]
MVAYLLRKNAKVNSDCEVLSPLQIAAMNDNTKIFKIILEHGAKINDHNIHNNKSPIELAVEHNNIEIARLIVDHKNFGLKCDQSLLHMAIKKNNLEMVSLLLETGADVDEYDDDGFAPIHHAVKARIDDILQLLLDYGADINAKNKYGNTSFSMVLMHTFHIFYAKSNGPVGLSFPGNTQNNSKLDILLDNDADIESLDIRKYLPHINDTNRIIINPKDNDGSSENKKRIIKQIIKHVILKLVVN